MEASDETKLYKDFIRENLPEWKNLSDDEIEFSKFFSLSNLVYKVTSKKTISPNPIVFRKFVSTFMGHPKEKRGFLSTEQENLIFQEMSKRGYGPKCLGVNEKYRIEEYINAEKLQPNDVRKPEVRRWHALAISNYNKLKVEGFKDAAPVYERILGNDEFFQQFDEKCALTNFNEDDQKIINEIKGINTAENRAFVKKVVPSDEKVICHGDQNLNNVLVSKDNGKVTLVDYERTGYSFRGDDIGCFIFFSVVDMFYPQPPHLKVEPENYPNDEELRDLAEYYVAFSSMDDETVNKNAEKMITNKELLTEYVEKSHVGAEFSKNVEKLMNNIKISFMAYSFCACIGSMKYYAAERPNILLYAQAACRYFLNFKAEYENKNIGK